MFFNICILKDRAVVSTYNYMSQDSASWKPVALILGAFKFSLARV